MRMACIDLTLDDMSIKFCPSVPLLSLGETPKSLNLWIKERDYI